MFKLTFSSDRHVSLLSTSPDNRFSLAYLKELHKQLIENKLVTEQNQNLVVEILRIIAEMTVYGDKKSEILFDFFCEKNMMATFLELMISETGRCPIAVQIQILQTLSILVSCVSNDTSLYYLLSNNRVNEIIMFPFDLMEDDSLLDHYISFLKTLSLRLNKQTVNFFYVTEQSSYPLLTQAIKLLSTTENMAKIAAQTIILNIYRLNDEMSYQYALQDIIVDSLCKKIIHNLVRQYETIVYKLYDYTLKPNTTTTTATTTTTSTTISQESNITSIQLMKEYTYWHTFLSDQLLSLEDWLYYIMDILHLNIPKITNTLLKLLYDDFITKHLFQSFSSLYQKKTKNKEEDDDNINISQRIGTSEKTNGSIKPSLLNTALEGAEKTIITNNIDSTITLSPRLSRSNSKRLSRHNSSSSCSSESGGSHKVRFSEIQIVEVQLEEDPPNKLEKTPSYRLSALETDIVENDIITEHAATTTNDESYAESPAHSHRQPDSDDDDDIDSPLHHRRYPNSILNLSPRSDANESDDSGDNIRLSTIHEGEELEEDAEEIVLQDIEHHRIISVDPIKVSLQVGVSIAFMNKMFKIVKNEELQRIFLIYFFHPVDIQSIHHHHHHPVATLSTTSSSDSLDDPNISILPPVSSIDNNNNNDNANIMTTISQDHPSISIITSDKITTNTILNPIHRFLQIFSECHTMEMTKADTDDDTTYLIPIEPTYRYYLYTLLIKFYRTLLDSYCMNHIFTEDTIMNLQHATTTTTGISDNEVNQNARHSDKSQPTAITTTTIEKDVKNNRLDDKSVHRECDNECEHNENDASTSGITSDSLHIDSYQHLLFLTLLSVFPNTTQQSILSYEQLPEYKCAHENPLTYSNQQLLDLRKVSLTIPTSTCLNQEESYTCTSQMTSHSNESIFSLLCNIWKNHEVNSIVSKLDTIYSLCCLAQLAYYCSFQQYTSPVSPLQLKNESSPLKTRSKSDLDKSNDDNDKSNGSSTTIAHNEIKTLPESCIHAQCILKECVTLLQNLIDEFPSQFSQCMHYYSPPSSSSSHGTNTTTTASAHNSWRLTSSNSGSTSLFKPSDMSTVINHESVSLPPIPPISTDIVEHMLSSDGSLKESIDTSSASDIVSPISPSAVASNMSFITEQMTTPTKTHSLSDSGINSTSNDLPTLHQGSTDLYVEVSSPISIHSLPLSPIHPSTTSSCLSTSHLTMKLFWKVFLEEIHKFEHITIAQYLSQESYELDLILNLSPNIQALFEPVFTPSPSPLCHSSKTDDITILKWTRNLIQKYIITQGIYKFLLKLMHQVDRQEFKVLHSDEMEVKFIDEELLPFTGYSSIPADMKIGTVINMRGKKFLDAVTYTHQEDPSALLANTTTHSSMYGRLKSALIGSSSNSSSSSSSSTSTQNLVNHTKVVTVPISSIQSAESKLITQIATSSSSTSIKNSVYALGRRIRSASITSTITDTTTTTTTSSTTAATTTATTPTVINPTIMPFTQKSMAVLLVQDPNYFLLVKSISVLEYEVMVCVPIHQIGVKLYPGRTHSLLVTVKSYDPLMNMTPPGHEDICTSNVVNIPTKSAHDDIPLHHPETDSIMKNLTTATATATTTTATTTSTDIKDEGEKVVDSSQVTHSTILSKFTDTSPPPLPKTTTTSTTTVTTTDSPLPSSQSNTPTMITNTQIQAQISLVDDSKLISNALFDTLTHSNLKSYDDYLLSYPFLPNTTTTTITTDSSAHQSSYLSMNKKTMSYATIGSSLFHYNINTYMQLPHHHNDKNTYEIVLIMDSETSCSLALKFLLSKSHHVREAKWNQLKSLILTPSSPSSVSHSSTCNKKD